MKYAYVAPKMFRPISNTIAWLGVAIGLTAAVACSATDAGSEGSYAEGVDACDECKTILVECTSTSKDESQFIACRDQWQQCQQGKGLSIGECSNPGDAEACDLCQQRLLGCDDESGDAEQCESEFSVCKAFLITRGDIQAQCTADVEQNTTVGCGICQEDYAACMSDVSQADGLQLCADKRVDCLTANLVPVEACPAPADAEACELCIAQHAQCTASAGPSCAEGFDQCAGALATNVTCELPSDGEGGGGEGGGGQGGGGQGGGSAGTCAHDGCSVGEALEETCDPCATEVCAQDSWCCTNEWDDLCVSAAEGIASCGCGS